MDEIPDVWGLLEQARNSIVELERAFVMSDYQKSLIETLSTALAQRDRFVLVSKEPTRMMLQAGYDAYKREYVDGGSSDDIWSRTWDAMLAAAPKPEGEVNGRARC